VLASAESEAGSAGLGEAEGAHCQRLFSVAVDPRRRWPRCSERWSAASRDLNEIFFVRPGRARSIVRKHLRGVPAFIASYSGPREPECRASVFPKAAWGTKVNDLRSVVAAVEARRILRVVIEREEARHLVTLEQVVLLER